MFIYEYGLGILLGLSLAGPPGSVNSVIANESLKSRLHGMGVGFGAMTADFNVLFISCSETPYYIGKYGYPDNYSRE